MKLFGKKKTLPAPTMSRQEALRLKPVKNKDVQEQVNGQGKIILSYPLDLKPLFVGLARKMGLWKEGKPLTKSIELDEIGAMTWKMVDGEHTVQDMVDIFAKEYKVLPKEAELAMTTFIKELGRRGLIAFVE